VIEEELFGKLTLSLLPKGVSVFAGVKAPKTKKTTEGGEEFNRGRGCVCAPRWTGSAEALSYQVMREKENEKRFRIWESSWR